MSTNRVNTTTQDKLSFKKLIYGLDDALVTQKLAFGFFLDRAHRRLNHSLSANFVLSCRQDVFAEVESSDQAQLFSSLEKYEWNGGSLTSRRFGEELTAFLDSPVSDSLQPHTKKELAALAELLKDTCIQDEIDLIRSGDLSLVLLARTGNSHLLDLKTKICSLLGKPAFSIEKEDVTRLTSLTLDKIRTLGVGEKAIFLAGTRNHETLICIERKESNYYEFSYYDSNNRHPEVYAFNRQALTHEEFWERIYERKLSIPQRGPYTEIADYAKESGQAVLRGQHRFAGLSPQGKNTCHFRCLLAFLKDRLIRQPEFSDQRILAKGKDHLSSVVEWNLFRKQFGEFLLQSPHLDNHVLADLSQVEQARREQTGDIEELFVSCIKSGNYVETGKAYLEVLKSIYPTKIEITTPKDNPLKILKKLHKNVLVALSEQLITPEEVQELFQKFNNPCLQKTFEIFSERFDERKESFHQSLHKELEGLSSVAHHLSHVVSSAAGWTGLFADKVQHRTSNLVAPLEKEQLYALLQFFERNPEVLIPLLGKPHIRIVLFQALEMGEFERVNALLQKLPERDQQQFYTCCSNFCFNQLTTPAIFDEYTQKIAGRTIPYSHVEQYTQENKGSWLALALLGTKNSKRDIYI